MSRIARSTNRKRAFVAGFISVAFLWAVALSASPYLHQRVHPDANRPGHSCVVTMVATGGYDHATQPPLVGAPDFIDQFGGVPALTSTWVKPLFLNAHIFAHAPPVLA